MYDDTADLQSDGPSWQQTTKAMASILSKFSQAFVVADGLDECQDRDKLTSLLCALADDPTSAVKIITFSRPEYPDLESSFKACQQLRVDIGNNKNDIETYILSKFSDDDAANSKDKERTRSIRDECLTKADGMFLWVSLMARSLKGPLTANQVLKRVKLVPKGLDSIYEMSVKRIWDQDEDVRTTAFDVLLWTINATRPLSEFEMLEAVAIQRGATYLDEGDKFPDGGSLMAICGDLIVLHNDGLFDLCHSSARDYLINLPANAPSPLAEYRLLQLGAQERLGGMCLTYLLFDTFEHRRANTYRDLHELSREHPFLPYAAANWGRHLAGQIECTMEIGARIRELVFSQTRRELSMQYLIRSQLDRDEKKMWNCWSSTPLHILSMFGLHQTAKSIAEVQSLMEIADGAGFLPLHYSLTFRNKDMCLWLLESATYQDLTSLSVFSKRPALHMAAENGWSEVVEKLISTGIDVNLRDRSFGATALLSATAGGFEPVVRSLLRAGADVNVRDRLGLTPLHFAALAGNIAAARQFLRMGADPNAQAQGDKNNNPMHHAAIMDSSEIIKLLHENGALIDQRNVYGETPLHYAAYFNAKASTALLIDLNAPKDARSDDSDTPLHLAADSGSFDTLKTLLHVGCDVYAVNCNGQTPLHRAAANGHVAIAQYILSKVSLWRVERL